MNNRVAKRIRREVYGDMAFRGREYYGPGRRWTSAFDKISGLKWVAHMGTVTADQLRQKYQAAKREARDARNYK